MGDIRTFSGADVLALVKAQQDHELRLATIALDRKKVHADTWQIVVSLTFGALAIAVIITACMFDWTRALESDKELEQRLLIERQREDDLRKADPVMRELIAKVGNDIGDTLGSSSASVRQDGLEALALVVRQLSEARASK